jgi:hypothetical protein
MTVADMRAALVAHHAPAAVEQVAAPAPVVTDEVHTTVTTVPAAAEPAAPVAAPKAKRAPKAKVEKVAREPQEERNGVKQPRSGGLCRAVWDALTALRATGVEPASKDARQLAQDNGWNVNNALIELSRWRKFNGIARQRA